MVRVKLSQETPFTNILIVVVVELFFFDDQAPFFHAGGARQSLKCFSNTHVIVMPNDLMLCGLFCRIATPNNVMPMKGLSISKSFSSFVVVLKWQS